MGVDSYILNVTPSIEALVSLKKRDCCTCCKWFAREPLGLPLIGNQWIRPVLVYLRYKEDCSSWQHKILVKMF